MIPKGYDESPKLDDIGEAEQNIATWKNTLKSAKPNK